MNSRTWPFSALRSVKDHPDQKIVGEILEAVLQSCRREEKITRLERIAAMAVDEHPMPANNDISFVARVRLLRIVSAWRVEFHRQRPVLEHESGPSLSGKIGRRKSRAEHCHIVWEL
jgi:hypothetical protein